MHVVQALVSMNIGGSELVATELAEYLTAHGHRVTVIAEDGPIGDRVRACGAHHLDWPIGRKRLATLKYIRRLRSWFEAERPDLVHVHSRWPAWICWRALKGLDPAIRPSFVTTMHGHYSVSGYSAVMAKGARVIAVSEHIRRYTLKNYRGADSDHIVTIHGGASREAFPYGHKPPPGWRDGVDREFPELAGKRWLMLPGRVTRWKGHSDFIRLVAALTEDYPDVQGVLVGGCREGSRYQGELLGQVARAGLSGRVTFVGNRLDIRDWMGEATLTYNLSNDPPEAFGRTALETLCLGRPLVAWNQGGVAEILAAMFPEGAVPVGDHDALEAKTRTFLATPPTVTESDAFSLEGSMSCHLRLYRDVLAEKEGT